MVVLMVDAGSSVTSGPISSPLMPINTNNQMFRWTLASSTTLSVNSTLRSRYHHHHHHYKTPLIILRRTRSRSWVSSKFQVQTIHQEATGIFSCQSSSRYSHIITVDGMMGGNLHDHRRNTPTTMPPSQMTNQLSLPSTSSSIRVKVPSPPSPPPPSRKLTSDDQV